MERRERRNGVVSENVAGQPGGRYDSACPGYRAQGTEGDDVPKALAVLQFLGHGLGAKHKTIVILKHIETKTQTQLAFVHTTYARKGSA